MTHRRFVRLTALPFLAAVLMIGLGAADARAQGYDGLIETQPGYGNTNPFTQRGIEQPDGGGYDGLVGWDDKQSASNPYGATPSSDIYGFVRGAGTSPEERKEAAKQEREAQRLARQQEIQQKNLQRAEELQKKLQDIGMERQKRVLEQHEQIIQNMKKQQQQQQGR